MPIYAYRCNACGHAQDVLQKMSDPVLTDCPECGKSTFAKQVTAAGFQLKGSGWYVTDFRNGGGSAGASGGSGESASSTAAPAGTASTSSSAGTDA
ncbi:zinc ribbon domain-containing protein [Pusillimonas sp. CC-YST705]|uniref:Zinc ribbon domain-containing protein n=1 Tax=Mesopusillimonas faecipullorum TaxID=2755040 RepID=A0ABS8CDK9_9BURK|nr:FmdB family zinc ribbon protein [Mesopusillimonas faecipullorum]MCB5364132.1 zinc ribbon domain-containing protein [Mesopusillimonas faecipullorum]